MGKDGERELRGGRGRDGEKELRGGGGMERGS